MYVFFYLSRPLTRRLEALQHAAEKVRLAASAFGPLHEQCAINWLDRSFSSGGSCTADLRALLHQHDAEFEACALSDDGIIDPRCAAVGKALEALQTQLDARAEDSPNCTSRDAREWVETVLLQPHPSPAVIREQKELLFSECSLGGDDNPSDCELLEAAIGEYYELVLSVK